HLSDAGLHARMPGHTAVRLTRSGTDIVVRGHVDATLVTRCARCTEPAQIVLRADMSLLLQAQPEKPPEAPVARSAKQKPSAQPAAQAHGTSKKKPKEKEKEPEHEFSAEDADVDTYDGETVVLDD